MSVGTAVFTAADARQKAQQKGRSGSGWDYEMPEWAEEKLVGLVQTRERWVEEKLVDVLDGGASDTLCVTGGTS